MWKNIQFDAKERFGGEGWQKKISTNQPRYWSTCSQEYGMFTTPTVRWRLEMEASPQKPTSATVPWETTNSFYGGKMDQFEKVTYRQHVTSMAASNAKLNRFQRSRFNPHAGIRLDSIPGLKAKDDFILNETRSNKSHSPELKRGRAAALKPVKVPSIHEKFLRSKYVTPWKVSYKAN